MSCWISIVIVFLKPPTMPVVLDFDFLTLKEASRYAYNALLGKIIIYRKKMKYELTEETMEVSDHTFPSHTQK